MVNPENICAVNARVAVPGAGLVKLVDYIKEDEKNQEKKS